MDQDYNLRYLHVSFLSQNRSKYSSRKGMDLSFSTILFQNNIIYVTRILLNSVNGFRQMNDSMARQKIVYLG